MLACPAIAKAPEGETPSRLPATRTPEGRVIPAGRREGAPCSLFAPRQPERRTDVQGLIVHAGAQLIGRQDLLTLPTPEATATHHPIPHARLVETILESLAYRQLQVVRDEYAVTEDGMRLFGFLEVNIEHGSVRLALCFRNSHDKSFSLGLIAGYRVFICDNLAFSGEFAAIARKHTKNVELVETVSVGVDRVQRHFQKTTAQIDAWQGFDLPDAQAKAVIYDAFVVGDLDAPKKLATSVHSHYFEPKYEEFEPRTMWSLSNAFTSSFQALEPVRQMEATASLAPFLARYH